MASTTALLYAHRYIIDMWVDYVVWALLTLAGC